MGAGCYTPDQSSTIVQSHDMCLYPHEQYCADLHLLPYCNYWHLMDIVFISCIYIHHVILLFSYFSFVHLLGRIWEPEFACPDIDPVVAPSEEDQEHFDSLAEQQYNYSWRFVSFGLAVCSKTVLFLCYRYVVVLYFLTNVLMTNMYFIFGTARYCAAYSCYTWYIQYKQCSYFIMIFVQVYRGLNMCT